MKLTGSYKLNVKKEIVWNALNNPEILKQCIPGCDSFEKENAFSMLSIPPFRINCIWGKSCLIFLTNS